MGKAYAANAFDGEGATATADGSRAPALTSFTPLSTNSLAMFEYFVHLDAADSPGDLLLATAEIPDGLEREQIEASDLQANWRESPSHPLWLSSVTILQSGQGAA